MKPLLPRVRRSQLAALTDAKKYSSYRSRFRLDHPLARAPSTLVVIGMHLGRKASLHPLQHSRSPARYCISVRTHSIIVDVSTMVPIAQVLDEENDIEMFIA